jgi:hypothetical protein
LVGSFNTLLKYYQFVEEGKNTIVDAFSIRLSLEAYEIANLKGVDSFSVALTAQINEKYNNNMDKNELPILWLDSLIFILPATNDTVIIAYNQISPPFKYSPAFLNNGRLSDTFFFNDIILSNIHNLTIAKTDFFLYDRSNGRELKRFKITRELVRKAEKRLWFHS